MYKGKKNWSVNRLSALCSWNDRKCQNGGKSQLEWQHEGFRIQSDLNGIKRLLKGSVEEARWYCGMTIKWSINWLGRVTNAGVRLETMTVTKWYGSINIVEIGISVHLNCNPVSCNSLTHVSIQVSLALVSPDRFKHSGLRLYSLLCFLLVLPHHFVIICLCHLWSQALCYVRAGSK